MRFALHCRTHAYNDDLALSLRLLSRKASNEERAAIGRLFFMHF